MRSQDKLSITIKNTKYGKDWVFVSPLFKESQCPQCNHKYVPEDWDWLPSFEDNARILFAMALCEDKKYPPPAKGRMFLIELLIELFEHKRRTKRSASWKGKNQSTGMLLITRFHLPRRRFAL